MIKREARKIKIAMLLVKTERSVANKFIYYLPDANSVILITAPSTDYQKNMAAKTKLDLKLDKIIILISKIENKKNLAM